MRRWVAGVVAAGVWAAGVAGVAGPAQASDGHLAYCFHVDKKKESYNLSYRTIYIEPDDISTFYLGGNNYQMSLDGRIDSDLKQKIWVLQYSNDPGHIEETYQLAVRHFKKKGIQRQVAVYLPRSIEKIR